MNAHKTLASGNECFLTIIIDEGIATVRIAFVREPTTSDIAEAEADCDAFARARGMQRARPNNADLS